MHQNEKVLQISNDLSKFLMELVLELRKNKHSIIIFNMYDWIALRNSIPQEIIMSNIIIVEGVKAEAGKVLIKIINFAEEKK